MKGEPGDDGSSGVDGIPGAKGDKGDPGPVGKEVIFVNMESIQGLGGQKNEYLSIYFTNRQKPKLFFCALSIVTY